MYLCKINNTNKLVNRIYHTSILQVRASWERHYANHYHDTNGFLNAIATYLPPIKQGYEYTSGQPPESRSTEAIPDASGIWKFQTAYAVDQIGGDLSTNISEWKDTNNATVRIPLY